MQDLTPYSRISVLVLVCIAGGCGSLPRSRSAEVKRNPRELSESAVVLPVPLVFQSEKFECGLTSLTMLFAYYGHEVGKKETARFKKKAEEEQGIVAEDLKTYLISQGFDTHIFKGTLSKDPPTGIYGHIDKGRPVVVVIASGRSSRHYVLVTGYDEEKSLIVVQDPVRGAILASEWQFGILWKYCDYFALLAVPKDEKETIEQGGEG
jgi:ABC-type bacteriocin/lantibiotic exporter with double-glycine peptidase domain